VLLTIHDSGDQIKKNKLGRACSTYGRRGEYRIFVGKPEGKRRFLRLRRRWEDDIKVDRQRVGWGKWNGFMMLRRGTGGGLSLRP